MRFPLGWISFLLVTALTTSAFGQVKGEVESVGFGSEGFFRGSCWTPMIVRLQATTGSPFHGRIIVKQDDLDGDHVTFHRDFDLGGNPEGGSVLTERYWMYFRPQPSLGAAQNNGLSLKELSQQLQVFVCDSHNNEIAQLPITQGISCLDIPQQPSLKRGTKLVLCVVGDDRPQFREYLGALGISEDVAAVDVSIDNVNSVLPESVLGYDAVDAVVWCDADPQKLTPKQRKALEQYIRRGGQFVILQSSKPVIWSTVYTGLGNLMPVDIKGLNKLANLDTFRQIEQESLARTFRSTTSERFEEISAEQSQAWGAIRGPFAFAVGQPRKGGMIASWFAPGSAPVAAPFIVRQPFGRGTITWVAQDIADPDLHQRDQTDDKWIFIWDKIFGWVNNPIPGHLPPNDDDRRRLGSNTAGTGPAVWLGWGIENGMNLTGTGAALMGVAVLFFVIYWVAAGPGAFLLLASKKRGRLNWFAFAVVGIAATAVTVGIVDLVLRGSARVKHVSFVSVGDDGHGVVRSQFGLYIPKSGPQTINLNEKSSQKSAGNADADGDASDARAAGGDFIAAYSPTHESDVSTFTAHLDYSIDVMDPAEVRIPFRSTLKKVQCTWSGPISGLDGGASISKSGPINGKLQNRAGVDLRNVYFVYYNPAVSTDHDNIIYLPYWDKDQIIDLTNVETKASGLTDSGIDPSKSYKGVLEHSIKKFDSWNHWFFNDWEARYDYGGKDDEAPLDSAQCPFPILSLFNRLPVMVADSANSRGRYDLDRRGLRFLDVSQNVAAGELVVLAESEQAMPCDVDADGDALKGTGYAFCQFILPLDRSRAQLPPPQIAQPPGEAPPVPHPATAPSSRL